MYKFLKYNNYKKCISIVQNVRNTQAKRINSNLRKQNKMKVKMYYLFD